MDGKNFNFQEAKQVLSLIDSKKNFSKQEIEQIQSYLKSIGYDLGNTGKNKDGVDGDWGNKTTTAINQLRSDFNTKYPQNNPDKSTKTYNNTAESFVPMESIGAYNVGQIMGNLFKRKNKPEETNPYKGMSAEELIATNPKLMQQLLIGKDYDLGKWKDDGNWGGTSKKAWEQAQKDGWVLKDGQLVKSEVETDNNSETKLENVKRYITNHFKNPVQNTIDGLLYTADQLGAPSNVTNYLRDLNVSLPYRGKAAIRAGIKTIMGNKSFQENYEEALSNPGFLTKATTINPLINTSNNFSNDELIALKNMAGDDFNINNSDIARVSGTYGGRGSIMDYVTRPDKVVQTAIGQSSGNADSKTITDIFDVNVSTEEDKKDNDMYTNLAESTEGFGYEDLRAIMPKFNMTSNMPNQYKIHTKVKFK